MSEATPYQCPFITAQGKAQALVLGAIPGSHRS